MRRGVTRAVAPRAGCGGFVLDSRALRAYFEGEASGAPEKIGVELEVPSPRQTERE